MSHSEKRQPKPGEKWIYLGGLHGEKGRIAMVLGVGQGVHHEGSHIMQRVWFMWDGKDSTENSWHIADFLSYFCCCDPCKPAICAEVDFCKQVVGMFQKRIDALEG